MDGIIEFPLISAGELAGEAWAAMGRRDADEALHLWRALREHSPERPDAHIWPIQVLWQSGRFAEAEAMADAAFANFPEVDELYVQHAWIATSQRDWENAAQRWATARSHAPERFEGFVWGTRALWQAGRIDDADAVAAEGRRRFPQDAEMMAESAWVATARQDWQEALRRWTLVRETFPDRLDALVGTVQALRLTGRIDECEKLATAALAQHPGNVDLLIEHVWLAAMRQDWAAARARLATARAAEPNSARIAQSLGAVEQRLREIAAAAEKPSPAPAVKAKIPLASDTSPGALMLAFESIGERCDFGAVQRHFGVEPLGLLRFAWSPLNALIAALEDRFAVVGSVEDTGFDLYGEETILRMKKYDLLFHTFIEGMAKEPDEKREAFYQQQRRRLLFLKDKLVGDLEEPQKILVYSTDVHAAADSDVARLFGALRAYGPNSLLYVRPATADRPEGAVEMLEDGLYAGYFPGLTNFVKGGQPPFDLWRQICTRTHQLAKAAAGNG